jgi:2-polyprenyl-3-methyl-5-hydroxy-6-metoxy-1,4-benzoquinol methylase
MLQNVAKCPLCGQNPSTLIDQRDFRGHKVFNRLCSNCGLVYQFPRMSEEELVSFYQNKYRQAYQRNEKPVPEDLAVQNKRANFLIKMLEQNGIEKVQRHLDIGSSSGILLVRIGEKFQCQAVGIEPGEAYRSYAEKHGLKVYATLDELNLSGELPFDLISMVHVLEHLPNPVDYLVELKVKWLRPDGVLLIEVPNLYAHDSFEVAHLTSFSRFTIEETLKKSGYSITFLHRHGQPRSRLIPLYITLLARPISNSQSKYQVQRERNILMKRRAGMVHRRIIERLFPKQAWLAESNR